MRIADVLRNKGAAVVTINPDATVGELLAGLAEQNIGAMVVVGAEGVVGIVSERDVVRQLHTYGASVLSRPVAKIMSTTVATCTKSDTVDKISVLMTENRVRQPDQCIGTSFPIGAGQRQGTTIPAARQRVPTKLPQQRSLRTMRQRCQRARRHQASQHRQVAIGVGVTTLPTSGHGAQPQVVRRDRRR